MSSQENINNNNRMMSKTGSRAYIDINELKKEEAALHLQSLGKYQTGNGGVHIMEGQ